MRREPAPAKLNLYLHVTGRRSDGYHLLDSLVAFADIADEVVAAPAAALSLDLAGPFAAAFAGPIEENLVWRAAMVLARHLGRTPAAALRLVKNLPLASGIGGGSSDAAATLRALAALWQAPLGADVLATLGLTLGADVPVCLGARTAWLGGIGEEVAPAPPLPPVAVVLANPGIALATAAVFTARTGPFSPPARFADVPRDAAHLAALIAPRGNDSPSRDRTGAGDRRGAGAAGGDGRRTHRAHERQRRDRVCAFRRCAGRHIRRSALRAAEPRWWVRRRNVAALSLRRATDRKAARRLPCRAASSLRAFLRARPQAGPDRLEHGVGDDVVAPRRAAGALDPGRRVHGVAEEHDLALHVAHFADDQRARMQAAAHPGSTPKVR